MPLNAPLLSLRLQVALVRDAESVAIDPLTGDSIPGVPIPMQPNPGWCTLLAGKIIGKIIINEEAKTASNTEGSVNILVQTELTQVANTVAIDPLTGDSSAGPTETLKPDQQWIDTVVRETKAHCIDLGYLVLS